MKQILTIDTGGTKTRIVLFSGEFSDIVEAFSVTIGREFKFPTPHQSDEYIDMLTNAIYDNFGDFLDFDGDKMIVFATRGLVNGNVVSDYLLNWRDFPVVEILERKFGVKVLLGNDTKVGTLGAFSPDFMGRGLYLSIGTGIGGGVIINGRLSNDLSGMEIGHMRFWRDGGWQSWQDFASGAAFFARYGRKGDQIPAGDPIWHEYAENLSTGLIAMLPILNLEKIALGGNISQYAEKFASTTSDLVRKNAWESLSPVEIVGAPDPDYAVNRGGLIYALQNWNFGDDN